jgi:hypothetical protein
MIAEHWVYDDSYIGPIPCCGSDTVSSSEYFSDPKNAELVRGSKFCCQIKGKNWEDIMVKYHKHKGWGPYIPELF